MAGESKTTTDHTTIGRWVEERGGRPARVKGTGSNGDPGLLRIDEIQSWQRAVSETRAW
jgi:transposase-like protein